MEFLKVTFWVQYSSVYIYIHEIVNIVNCGIVLYAYDRVLYHHSEVCLQINLKVIAKWCNANLLTINVKRSHWMKLKLKVCTDQVENLEQHKLKICDSELTEFATYKTQVYILM